MNRIAGHSRDEIVQLVETNLWATWSNFGRAPGCSLHDEGNLLWFETPIPFHPYNTILKFQVEQDVDRKIDELLRHLSNRGVPVLWIVHPSGRPHDLVDRLRARDLQEFEIAPGMARSLEDLPVAPPLPDGIEIREAHEDTDLGVLSEFAAWRWGVPEAYRPHLHDILTRFQVGRPDSSTRMWMAYKDGVPVSKLGLCDGPGSAGIYAVATKPEARGLGTAPTCRSSRLPMRKSGSGDVRPTTRTTGDRRSSRSGGRWRPRGCGSCAARQPHDLVGAQAHRGATAQALSQAAYPRLRRVREDGVGLADGGFAHERGRRRSPD